jgi:hypothetical protein
MEILGVSADSVDYGKGGRRRQITFRVGPVCMEKLEQTAQLFNMTGSQYTKALLYQHLQIFSESTDLRRRRPQKKRKRELGPA